MLRDPVEGGAACEARKHSVSRMFMVAVLLGLGAAMLLFIGVGSVAAATVNVSTPSAAEQGSTFSVTVQVLSVTDLYGAQFSLSFNPAVLEAMPPVSEGSFLKQGASTFWLSPTIDNNAGTISGAAQTRLKPATNGVSGSGALAVIPFRAKAIGTSNLSLSGVALSDSNAHAISFTTQPGSVTVSPPPPPLVPPDTQIASGPTGTIKTTTATFTWTGLDPDGYVASYEYRMDSGTWETIVGTSKTFTGLSKGNHTFYVRARDNDGLLDPTPPSRSFTVYITANPDTQIVSGPSGTVEGDTATFEWTGTDADGRVVCYLHRIDNQTWILTTRTTVTYVDLPYGTHAFLVKAVDDEGLEDITPAERIFTLVPYWWEGEVDRLNQTIRHLEGELQAAQAELQELETERQRLGGQVESLQSNLTALQREKVGLQSQIRDLESQKNELVAKVYELENWNGQLEANNTDMARRLNATEEKYRALSQGMDRLTSELGDKDKQLQQAWATLEETRGEVELLGNQTAALQQQMEELQTGMSELVKAKESLEAENEALKKERKAGQDERSALQEEIYRLKGELLTARQETTNAKNQAAGNQSKIEELEAEKDAVTWDLAVLAETNQSLIETRRALMAVLGGLAAVAVILLGLTLRYRRRASRGVPFPGVPASWHF